jgi:hypothetical protein
MLHCIFYGIVPIAQNKLISSWEARVKNARNNEQITAALLLIKYVE